MSARLDAAVSELVAAIRAELTGAAPDGLRAYSVQEAADILGISRAGCYRLIQSGQMRSRRVGSRRLVPTSAIRDFLDGNAEGRL
jgi:excisionase family DNA binding protein